MKQCLKAPASGFKQLVLLSLLDKSARHKGLGQGHIYSSQVNSFKCVSLLPNTSMWPGLSSQILRGLSLKGQLQRAFV